MRLARFRYWQWLIFAILVGITSVGIQKWSTDSADASNIPRDLSGQQERFEHALTGEVEGHRLLRNIRVFSRSLTTVAVGRQRVHLITAEYCTGESEDVGGKRQYVWRESIFVLPVPYCPQSDLSQSDPALASALAKRPRSSGGPTVLDLLSAAKSVHGIGYSYAWWDDRPWILFGGGSVLLLGIIFPAAVHLAAFGSLRRPPLPRRRDEQRSATAPASAETQSAPTDETDIQDTPAPAASTSAARSSATSIRQPTIEVTEPAIPSDADPHDFAMKPDDYYPTERPKPR